MGRLRRSLTPHTASAFSGDVACPSFNRFHTRAEQALPLLKAQLLGAPIDDGSLVSGLKQLAERLPSLKRDALAARAVREYEKLQWALPSLDEALPKCCHSGFDHASCIIAHLRSQLSGDSADATDKHIGRAFRKAIAQVKAGTIEASELEDATLAALRETRLTFIQ